MYETLELRRDGPVAWLTLNRPERLNASPGAGSLEQVVALEDRNQVLRTRTGGFREGAGAFLEKRPPVWRDA